MCLFTKLCWPITAFSNTIDSLTRTPGPIHALSPTLTFGPNFIMKNTVINYELKMYNVTYYCFGSY